MAVNVIYGLGRDRMTNKAPSPHDGPLPPPSLSPGSGLLLVIGLASLFSSLLIYSGTAISFLRLPGLGAHMGTFAETLLLASTVVAAVAGAMALRGASLSSAPFMALIGVVYVACSLAFGFVGYLDVADTAVYMALSIITGVANVCLVLVWGRICGRLLSIRPALLVVGMASALSAILCFLYGKLPLEATLGLFFLAALASVVIPLTLQSLPALADSPQTARGPDDEGAQPDTISRPSARQTLASLVDVALMPGLGLIAFAFVMAVMRTAFNEGQVAYLSMMVLAALGLVAYAALKRGRFLLPGGLQLTFLPIAALVLLATIAITATVNAGEAVAVWLTYGVYSLAAVLTIATLCAVAHAGEFSSDLVFSVAVAAFCGTSFVGQMIAGSLDEELINVAFTLTTTVYAFALALVSYVRRIRDIGASSAEEGVDADAASTAAAASKGGSAAGLEAGTPSLQERCDALATEFGLTSREREILAYLAEGHNGSYIASALFISPNTARTHLHNIYRKLDVSSREDILRLTRTTLPQQTH